MMTEVDQMNDACDFARCVVVLKIGPIKRSIADQQRVVVDLGRRRGNGVVAVVGSVVQDCTIDYRRRVRRAGNHAVLCSEFERLLLLKFLRKSCCLCPKTDYYCVSRLAPRIFPQESISKKNDPTASNS